MKNKESNRLVDVFNKCKDKLLLVLKNILKIIVKFLKTYKYLIALDVIVFILAVFIESLFMYKVGQLVWVLATILFVVIPTIVFNVINKVSLKDIKVSLFIFYLLFLIFLKFCTMRDLYGITSGDVDFLPNFIDAIFVVFIFTMLEYIPTGIIEKIKNKKTKKEVKKKTKKK